MVVGLDLFTEHFAEYTDHYILIGGSACHEHFRTKRFTFRRTDDLDIILVIEVLSNEFVDHFYDFIERGEYRVSQKGEKKGFFRFINPAANGYPTMLELFSRNPDINLHKDGFHLTDIPTDEDVSSLSAILLDDDYYHFTRNNSMVRDGLHVASDVALVCLKAKAFLNNTERKANGEDVHEIKISKHKNDVIRLGVTLDPTTRIPIADSIANDLRQFIEMINNEKIDIRAILKAFGLPVLSKADIMGVISDIFQLNPEVPVEG